MMKKRESTGPRDKSERAARELEKGGETGSFEYFVVFIDGGREKRKKNKKDADVWGSGRSVGTIEKWYILEGRDCDARRLARWKAGASGGTRQCGVRCEQEVVFRKNKTIVV